MRIAYFTHAPCVGNDFALMAIHAIERACIELHVEFQDRLQTLIDRAHEQDGNVHDRWRQNGDAFTTYEVANHRHLVNRTQSEPK